MSDAALLLAAMREPKKPKPKKATKKKSAAKAKAASTPKPTKAAVAKAAVAKPEKKYTLRDRGKLLDLGRSRRNVAPRSGRGMMAKWGGNWHPRDVAELVRKNKPFAQWFITAIPGRADEYASGAKTRAAYEQELINRIAKSPERFRRHSRRLLYEISQIANQTRTHPWDLAVISTSSIGNVDAARGQSVMNIYLANSIRFTSDATTLSNYFVPLLNTMKRVTGNLASSQSYLLRQTATAIRNLSSGGRYRLFTGFFKGRNLKAWRRGKGRTIGVEVVKFGYIVPTKFDDKGDAIFDGSATVMEHESAAVTAEKLARDASELGALLGLTPAGRLFLCASGDTSGIFLATARKPARRLFQIRSRSPRDAVLHGQKPWDMMTGFVV